MSTPSGPEKLGDILRDFLQTSGLAHKLRHGELYTAWHELVGPEVAAHTRVVGFAHHKLYVDVDSAARRHELDTFYKSGLLDGLRERLPGLAIQDLVFRPGAVHRG